MIDYAKLKSDYPDTISLTKTAKLLKTTPKALENAAKNGRLPFVLELTTPGEKTYYKVITDRFIKYMQGSDLSTEVNEEVAKRIVGYVFKNLSKVFNDLEK